MTQRETLPLEGAKDLSNEMIVLFSQVPTYIKIQVI